jgi:hypothetical protein
VRASQFPWPTGGHASIISGNAAQNPVAQLIPEPGEERERPLEAGRQAPPSLGKRTNGPPPRPVQRR